MKKVIVSPYCLLVVLLMSNASIWGGREKGIFVPDPTFEPLEGWKKPDPRLRLDQVTYLGSHNAHANVEEGFAYAQQLWSLKNQLKRGVRHFLIDIWPYKGRLLLCHGRCEISTLLKMGRKHNDLQSALLLMKNWLDTYPDEIITLELENFATGKQTYDVIKSVPGLENYLLTRSEYDPLEHGGKWPTIQNLIERNRRLIIFDTQDTYRYSFDTDTYMVRNMYGTFNIGKAARLRGEERPNRGLYQLNYFGTITSPHASYNRPKRLKQLLRRCQENGVVSQGKTPNFVAIDFVDRGNAMKWVNKLNMRAALTLS